MLNTSILFQVGSSDESGSDDNLADDIDGI